MSSERKTSIFEMVTPRKRVCVWNPPKGDGGHGGGPQKQRTGVTNARFPGDRYKVSALTRKAKLTQFQDHQG